MMDTDTKTRRREAADAYSHSHVGVYGAFLAGCEHEAPHARRAAILYVADWLDSMCEAEGDLHMAAEGLRFGLDPEQQRAQWEAMSHEEIERIMEYGQRIAEKIASDGR